MAYLDKIKVNNTNVDVHDSRVASIDTTPTENSSNPITSGAVYSVLGDIQSALDAILGSGVTLITFTIEGTSYQAEEGMTWQQWVDSSYNTGGWNINSHSEVSNSTYTGFVNNVNSQDVIIANNNYTIYVGGGSSD